MGLSCRNFEMSSRGSSCNVKKLCPIRIRSNPPPPAEWTLVKEYHMEKRDDYQVWTSSLQYHLENMRHQLISYSEAIELIDQEIEEESNKLLSAVKMKDEETSNKSKDDVTLPKNDKN